MAGRVCELASTVYIAKPYPKGLGAEFALVIGDGGIPEMSITASRDAASAERTFSTENTRKIEFQTPPVEKFYFVSVRVSTGVTNVRCY